MLYSTSSVYYVTCSRQSDLAKMHNFRLTGFGSVRRYLLAISALGGPEMGFSPVLRFLLGHQENEGKPSFAFLVSWRRVEIWGRCCCGAFGGGGGGGVRYDFALDVVLVTCEL